MKSSARERTQVIWKRYGFKNLLVWLLIYMVVGPLLDSLPYTHKLASLFLTVVLLSAISAVNRHRKLLTLSISLMILTLGVFWLAQLTLHNVSRVVSSILLALYLGTLVYSFLRHLLAVTKVNGNVICAALCLYLMIGLLWGALFQILDQIGAGSLAGGMLDSETNLEKRVHLLNYFSFVTLSTLGYGDITPRTPGAAALCQAEAILGQFFSVALVARLVGIQVAQQVEDRT